MTDFVNPVSMTPRHQEFFPETVSRSKSLGSPHTKALGADPSLATWYEQAYDYYQQVRSGAAPMPEGEAWNDFIMQMNWAYEQLQGPSWEGDPWGIDDSWYLEEDPFASPQGGGDPYGAQVGPSGNLIHNKATAELGLIGGVTREIWSNEINIRIPSLSAQVQAIVTQDDSVQPPESVLKIRVTDPATGQSDTFIVHDYEDAEVHVFTPEADQVQDDQGLLQWQSYQETPSAEMGDAVNMPVETLEDGTYLVEAPMGEVIDFTPPWNPNGGENQTWELWGDFNLNLRPSDRVHVSEGTPNDPDGFTLRITRRNGQVITLHTHEGFKGNLNANPENITWGGESGALNLADGMVTDTVLDESLSTDPGATPLPPAGPDESGDSGVPPEFADHFTLNGEDFSDGGAATEAAGDPPTRKEDGQRIWDGRDFDISSRNDGKESYIYARGKVTLRATSNQEYWRVTWDASRQAYKVEVFGDADHSAEALQETFYVDNMVDELVFDVDPSHLSLEEPVGQEFDEHAVDTGSPQGEKITILGEEDKGDKAGMDWPTQLIQAAIPRDISGTRYAQKMDLLISGALKTGDWASFEAYLVSLLSSNPGKANDGVRTLIQGIYDAVDQNDQEFDKLMDLIPENVRNRMVELLMFREGELNETQGERWNSAETASRILATMGED